MNRSATYACTCTTYESQQQRAVIPALLAIVQPLLRVVWTLVTPASRKPAKSVPDTRKQYRYGRHEVLKDVYLHSIQTRL